MPNLRRKQAAHLASLKAKKKRLEKRKKYPAFNRIQQSIPLPYPQDIQALAKHLGINLE